MDSSEPMPSASRARPSSPGVTSRRWTTAGTRDTQVPSSRPLAVKTSAVPSAAVLRDRCCSGARGISPSCPHASMKASVCGWLHVLGPAEHHRLVVGGRWGGARLRVDDLRGAGRWGLVAARLLTDGLGVGARLLVAAALVSTGLVAVL